MIKKLEILLILFAWLVAFEFMGIVREGKIVQKTLSVGNSYNLSGCNQLASCTPNFSPNLVLSVSEAETKKNQVLENDKVKTVNKPTEDDYCLTVPVLTYHRIQPWKEAVQKGQTAGTVDNQIFDQQMSYLAQKGYHTITAEELVNALINKSSLPEKSIVITLDDGYENAYTYAFPVAQRYQIIINLMIPTGLVGNSEFLSWDQIKEMQNSGRVYFTAHSWSHFPLNQGQISKIQFEVKTSKEQLEQHTGQSISIFTYPYGSFNDQVINVLKENSFLAGFSTLPGKLQCRSYLMTLRRIGVGNTSLFSYGL